MATRTVSVNLVASIGQYVSGMNTAAAATMRLGDTAKASTAKTKSGFDLAGKGALLMGAAVVGGLGMAVGASMKFEKAMSGVAAATTASGSALSDLRDAAMKAGADTAYSATEAAQAITEMGKAGVSTADILDGGLNGALSLAAAGQLDVAKAAEIASTAMTQFSLSGEDLPHVADLLAAGAGKAMGSVEDLGMALNQAGLVASSAGLSIEETTGTLAAFASAGLIGSDAGTSLRSALLHLQNATGPAQAAMDEYGISLYDAQGNFVGMSALAGQLQEKMSGLTPATRDAAMAQIFGSDAVRAANVLYKEGASGIAAWTSKVDDAGYAAEQAAKLQDNLAGDLEKLGGAFETLMISIGSGAQGPLRALVQGLTDMLDGAMALGGPLKAMGGWVADNMEIVGALATALGVQLVGGIGAVTIAFNRMILTNAVLGLSNVLGAVLNLPAAFRTAGTAIGTFMTAAAPLVAVGAVVFAIGKTIEFATAAGDARDEIADMWDAVDDSRGSEQLAAFDGVIDQLQTKIRTLRDDIGEVQTGFGTGFFFLAENTDDIQKLNEYEDALERVKEQQDFAEASAGVMSRRFGLTGDEVLALASKYDIDLTGSMSETFRLMQNFYSMEFGAKPTEATIGLKTAMDDAKTAVDDAKTAVDGFKLSLDILTGANVSMIEVETALGDALRASEGAMEGLTGSVLNADGTLNAYSESGSKASDVLLSVRDSGNQMIATMIEQGATTDEVRAKDAELRASFIRSAGQMGISGEAAEVLADKILGVPSERETKFAADIAAAADKIADLQRQIDDLHGKDIEIRVRAAGRFIINPQGGLQEYGDGYGIGDGPGAAPHAPHAPRGISMPFPGIGDGPGPAGINITQNTRSLESTMSSFAAQLEDAKPAGLSAGVGYKAMWASLKGVFPSADLHSAFRPGAITATGNRSYHGMGRAIDVTPSMGIFNWIARNYPNSRELIYSPAGSKQIHNGSPHMYSGVTRANHWDHVHWAMANGGVIGEPVIGRGLWSGGSYAFGERGPETVLPGIRSREFSGGGGSGGGAIDYERLAKAIGRSTSISVTAPPEYRKLAAAVVDAQQDREFLHG